MSNNLNKPGVNTFNITLTLIVLTIISISSYYLFSNASPASRTNSVIDNIERIMVGVSNYYGNEKNKVKASTPINLVKLNILTTNNLYGSTKVFATAYPQKYKILIDPTNFEDCEAIYLHFGIDVTNVAGVTKYTCSRDDLNYVSLSFNYENIILK